MNKRRRTLLAGLLTSLITPAGLWGLGNTSSLAVESGSGSLDNLNSLLEPIWKKAKLPCLAGLALVDGEVKGAGAVGVRKKGDSTPVTIHDKFHIGSCTKSMTATLVATFVEDGKLGWDTTVGDIITSEKVHEDFRKVTLEQLLSHTGGFPTDLPLEVLFWSRTAGKSVAELREYMAMSVLKEAPAYPPGEGWKYSNSGFVVAGYMLEILTGESWETLMRKRVFDPLGMDSAGFGAPATPPDQVDQPWGHLDSPVNPGPLADNPPALGPAGTVHCSLFDLAKFVRMHVLKETGPVLKEKATFEKLHTAVSQDPEYAMGWLVPERKWAHGPVLHHAGSNTMFFAVIWASEARKFAAITATNVGPGVGAKPCDEAVGALIGKYLP